MDIVMQFGVKDKPDQIYLNISQCRNKLQFCQQPYLESRLSRKKSF